MFLSTVSCEPRIIVNNNSLSKDVTRFVSKFELHKSVSLWFVGIKLEMTLPLEFYNAILPLETTVFDITLYFKKNSQTVDTFVNKYIVFSASVNNVLEKDGFITCTFILMPINSLQILQGFDFYCCNKICVKKLIDKVLTDVSTCRIDKPSNTQQFYNVFIPYMTKLKALAYICREFGYSHSFYTGYVEKGFKLINWDIAKETRPKVHIKLFPDSVDVKDMFIQSMQYVGQLDTYNRFQNVDFVKQHNTPIKCQPFCKKDNQSNMSCYDAKNVLDTSMLYTLYESHFIDVTYIPEKHIFKFDLLDPFCIMSNVSQFMNLVGLYCLTDWKMSITLDQETPVPQCYMRLTYVPKEV